MNVPRIELTAHLPDADRREGVVSAETLEADYASMTIEDAFRLAPALARWARIIRLYDDLSSAIIRQVHADEAKRRT